MSFLRAFATVSGLTLASRVFGFVRDVLSAAIMGAGPIADAFFVALRLANFFRRMTAAGAFSVSFVPLFSKTLEQEGQEPARQFANQAMAFLLAILVPFCVLAIIFMPQVLYVLAPGFNTEGGVRFDMAVTFTRITFLYLLFMSLSALVGGMLNTLDKFAIFAVAPVLFNVVQILFLLLAFWFPTPGHALAWAVLLSGVLQFVWMVWSLHRHGWRLQLVRPVLNDKIHRLLRLMGPGIVGASAVQINLLVDTIIASTLPVGAVSFLYYADRLNQLPLGLIGTAVGTALLPKLAQRIAARDAEGSLHLFNRALEWTLLLTLPCAVGLALIAEPIIGVLFQRGAFDAAATLATAGALRAYALGLPAFVGVKVLSTALYAQEDTKTPVIVTLICATVNIVLCLILIRSVAHVGIALATAIAGWLQVAILAGLIHRRKNLHFDAQMQRNLLRIVIACAVMAVVVVVCHVGLFSLFQESGFKRMAALAVTLAASGIAYASFIILLKVIDLAHIKQSLAGEK